MRMLRGARVMPLVTLSSKPMKTKYKMGERPDFQIVSWHLPGGDEGLLAAPAPTSPQLSGPAEAQPTQPNAPKADPISSGPQPKPPVNATLGGMGDVKPVTSGEVLDDSIPW
jgi:hypothetical protein